MQSTPETKKIRRTGNLLNEKFLVDSQIQLTGSFTGLIEGCEFFFQKNGSLILDNCNVRKCIFHGQKNLHDFQTDSGKLIIRSCEKFEEVEIKEQFRSVNLENSIIKSFTDVSTVTKYELLNTEITNFSIEGVCEVFRSTDIRCLSNKKKSVWSKIIIKDAICEQTIFENIEIDPFYFATKCKKKDSLDISSATLIDNWSMLRKNYSGLSLFIVFLLTFLFFLPLLTHSFFLLTVTRIHPLTEIYTPIPLWETLIFGGLKGYQAWVHATLTILLILYNIGRIWMTISISKLKEEEKLLQDSNFNLATIHPTKYKNQLCLHKILRVLFWLSIAYSSYKLMETLFILVPNFRNPLF